MPNRKAGLGSEHPLCDSLQLAMLISYFVVWGIDSVSHFLFRVSTVIIDLTSFPLLLLPSFLSLIFGIHLALKSHDAVFGETIGQTQLVDSGVYSWVRPPMYLGTLMVCLGFFFAVSSLLSLGIWIVFFIVYDRMATYEEKDLTRILGEEYIAYRRRVGKWFPRLKGNPRADEDGE